MFFNVKVEDKSSTLKPFLCFSLLRTWLANNGVHMIHDDQIKLMLNIGCRTIYSMLS